MKFPFSVKAVLIDMDGVLLDTERIAMRAWMEAEAETEIKLPEAFYLSIIGQNMLTVEQRMGEFFATELEVKDFLNVANRHYKELFSTGDLPVKKGAREFLKFLRETSIPRCLVTSTYRKLAEDKLKLAGMADFLPEKVCGDEVEKGKPAPDIYLAGAKKLGFRAPECLAIEDSENGLRSAMTAGCRTVHIPDLGQVSVEVQSKCDGVFRDFDCLREAFQRNEIGFSG